MYFRIKYQLFTLTLVQHVTTIGASSAASAEMKLINALEMSTGNSVNYIETFINIISCEKL